MGRDDRQDRCDQTAAIERGIKGVSNTERLVVLISLILVGLAFSLVIEPPAVWLLAAVLVGVVCVGTDHIVHLHWRVHIRRRRYAVTLWVVPALLVLGATLFLRLPMFSSGIAVIAGLVITGVLLTLVIVSEYHTMDREDPLYGGAVLAAQIFQERLTKLLPSSLLTVGYEGRRMASPFYVQGQAAADQTLDHLQKIRAAADDLKNSVVSPEELQAAQQKVIEDFNRELRTAYGICKTILDSELYRLGSNYASIFPNQIRRFDANAVKEAANNWIFPGGEVILLRGPAAELKPALSSLGTIRRLP